MTSLQSFTFLVRDHVDGPHRVTFVRHAPGHLSAECTCQEHIDADRCCTHCLRLLAGDTTDLLSGNEVEVEVLEWWLACLDLKQSVTRVREAQAGGRVPAANAASVFAFWPDLSAEDFRFEPEDESEGRRGAA